VVLVGPHERGKTNPKPPKSSRCSHSSWFRSVSVSRCFSSLLEGPHIRVGQIILSNLVSRSGDSNPHRFPCLRDDPDGLNNYGAAEKGATHHVTFMYCRQAANG